MITNHRLTRAALGTAGAAQGLTVEELGTETLQAPASDAWRGHTLPPGGSQVLGTGHLATGGTGTRGRRRHQG